MDIELPDVKKDQYADTNVLAMPAKKEKEKVRRLEDAAPVKRLSKKQRKRLEKILDTKKKKAQVIKYSLPITQSNS